MPGRLPKKFPPGIYVPKEFQQTSDIKSEDLPPPTNLPPQDLPLKDLPPRIDIKSDDLPPPQDSPPQDLPPPKNLPPKNLPPKNLPPKNLPRSMSSPAIYIERDSKPTFPYQQELDSSDTFDSEPEVLYNILWTSKTIKTLENIMVLINRNKIMKAMGHIAKYYIDHNGSNDEYNILTLDVPAEDISRDVMILAYLCEIYLKKELEANTVITDYMIYQSFPLVISVVINEVYTYQEWMLNYNETYMVNLISDITPSKLPNKRDIITCSYYITRQIITLHTKYRILDQLDTLYVQSQDIDLSVIPSDYRRSIMNILGVKRTIYLRIFLLLTARLIKEKTPLNQHWITRKSQMFNHQQFIVYIQDMLIETLITITGLFIKIDNLL